MRGAIDVLSKKNNFLFKMVQSLAKHENISLEKPLKDIPRKFLDTLFEGSSKRYQYSFESENTSFKFTKKFPGILNWLERKYKETTSERIRSSLEAYMDIKECPDCKGRRLNPVALNTKIMGKNIMDICAVSIEESLKYFENITLTGEKRTLAKKLTKEIISRLRFLVNVGLGYLTLNRPTSSLSGGESQRIRLATQMGSQLCGVLYVLDEPSIGLHQRDNLKLIKTLKALRDLGNTVVVVEHDEETMRASDYLVDLGPGAGVKGGEIVARGKLEQVVRNKKSMTAKYLTRGKTISIPQKRRTPRSFIKLTGAGKNNIKNLNIKIPLGIMTCIAGVSGSGKSTLTHEILIPAIKNALSGKSSHLYKEHYKSIEGIENIDSLIGLDQSPIGRSPHSNPSTYTGLFGLIRTLFSTTQESQVKGYKPGRFSFNVKGGRCDECEGHGVKKIEMHFLPDVYITCSECGGDRYNGETLSILYRGKNIAEVLAMEVDEAHDFFKNHQKMRRILATLQSVGLGYMNLGQSATTLSGGEAQRLKLSRELAKKTRGHCLYVLDEPTTGLHFEDVCILLKALTDLVDQGNSVIIIEHNLDVIKTADYIIDLGPEGGEEGGQLIAHGPPEDIAKSKKSHTGRFLKKILDDRRNNAMH